MTRAMRVRVGDIPRALFTRKNRLGHPAFSGAWPWHIRLSFSRTVGNLRLTGKSFRFRSLFRFEVFGNFRRRHGVRRDLHAFRRLVALTFLVRCL